MSKGSKPRPIDKQSYDSNYDNIFGKKDLSSLKPLTDDLREEMLDLASEIGKDLGNISKGKKE